MHNKKDGGKKQALLQVICNAEILADKTKKNPQQQWNLVIHCETADHKSDTLSWSELLKLATTNVNTIIFSREIAESIATSLINRKDSQLIIKE